MWKNFLFELGTADIFLGYSWLATLGDTRINWGTHTLSFKVEIEWGTLVGDPTLMRAHISLNSMVNTARGGMLAYLMELTTLFKGEIGKQRRAVHPKIEILPNRYNEAF